LHLQHGPIDLIIKADGQREQAFAAAEVRFATILEELVAELPLLRARLSPNDPRPQSPVAQRMDTAAQRFDDCGFLTRMAAVAGSVADEVLTAMKEAADLRRAMVNNGGDIALHLARGESYAVRMRSVIGDDLGDVVLRGGDGIAGIATSGRHGRSFSLGIADSVTVLARTAAMADTAATLIANAVNLPGHPAITRSPAHLLAPDSDLGTIPVVTGCGALTHADRDQALTAGLARAEMFLHSQRIAGCALFLQGAALSCGSARQTLKEIEHA
jgi:ApbE superfamily uncharacterized protein (UPF0280 family)